MLPTIATPRLKLEHMVPGHAAALADFFRRPRADRASRCGLRRVDLQPEGVLTCLKSLSTGGCRRSSASPSSTVASTESTHAEGGPRRAQRSSASRCRSSPSATASTQPSARLRTQPRRPSRCASRHVAWRKPTPWTMPRMTSRLAGIRPRPGTSGARSRPCRARIRGALPRCAGQASAAPARRRAAWPRT